MPVQTELPSDVPSCPSCRSLVTELFAQLQKQAEKVEALENFALKLVKDRYGRKADWVNPDQLRLFAPEQFLPQENTETEEHPLVTTDKPEKKSKPGHPSRQIPDNLPHERCEHNIDDNEKLACPKCHSLRKKISEKIDYQFEYRPASLYVKENVRSVYACSDCKGEIIEAQKPSSPIARGLAGPGLLAFVITSKYSEHSPLYRQEQILERNGLKINRSTLCEWLSQTVPLLQPVFNLMKARVLAGEIISTDDTILPVIDKSLGRARKARAWTYVGDKNNPYNIFDYTESRKRDGPKDFLKDYKGYLQADAFTGYDCVYASGDVIEVACWAHARRKFVEAAERSPKSALPAVAMIKVLYDIEKEAKEPATEERYLLRQQKSVPQLKKIKEWLDNQKSRVLPKSLTAKAINYALAQWAALNRYTENGDLEIGRVNNWRGCLGAWGVSVVRLLSLLSGVSIQFITPFPVAARQTGRADFPHPAFTCNQAFTLDRSARVCGSA
jgi:transposase